MKIKIKLLNPLCEPEIIAKGDWIDLRAAEDVHMLGPDTDRFHRYNFANRLIPLGVAMQLPKGFEAVVNPRSSSYSKFGVLLANSQGVIDGKLN